MTPRDEAIKALERLKEISEIVYRTNDSVDTPTECFYKIGPVTMGKLGDALFAVDASKAIATLRASEAPSGEAWRPIEEAPKDGTVILVWRPSLAMVKIQIACFVNGNWESYGGGPMWQGPYQPTHWQPLPLPPSKGASQ